jgi:hypothetical protein
MLDILKYSHESMHHNSKVWPPNTNVENSKKNLQTTINIAEMVLIDIGELKRLLPK